jgi:hypothetical protein
VFSGIAGLEESLGPPLGDGIQADETPLSLRLSTRLEVAGTILPDTIPLLVHSIYRKQKTGILTVRDGEREKSLYIRAGRILFATSNEIDDRLGQVLIQEGMVSFADVVRGTEKAIRAKKRLGTVLMETGILEPKVLIAAVRCQVTQILNDIFRWTGGICEFAAGDLPSEEIITLDKSTGDMIIEAMKGVQSSRRILDAIGGLEQSFKLTDDIESASVDLTLGVEEWHLLSFFEQSMILEEVCQKCPLNDLDICRWVWSFLVLGLLDKVFPSANGQPH